MTRNKKLVKMMALAVAASTVATSVPAYAAFDATYYAQQNPDVVAVCGDSRLALYQHYLMSGRGEGRFGSASQADAVNAALASGETLTFAPMALLGMESTPYDPTIDRATNVQIAADRLNGTLLVMYLQELL